MLKPFQKLHFIGIGGIGMSGLAGILLSQGKTISGSDLHTNSLTAELATQGAVIHSKHKADNVPSDADYVVVSTAIAPTNPEYLAAQQHGIEIIHRSEVLSYLLASSRGISITGTHGKTTTSALMALILSELGLDPTIVIGGEIPQLGTNARAGKGDFTVAEVDESDQSLRHLSTEFAIITNLEVDHLDHYKGLDEIIEAVLEFLHNQPEHGKTFVNLDDPGIQLLMSRLPETKRQQCITFALHDPTAQYRALQPELGTSGSTFEFSQLNATTGESESLGQFQVGIPGTHNIYNALSTLACAHHLGLDLAGVQQSLQHYAGVKRRFQEIGILDDDVKVLDDYAHHPSEIRATLSTAKLQNRSITAVFQPHRYSRTQALLQDFAESFELADRIILTDIYAASENPLDFDVDIQQLVQSTRQAHPQKPVLYFQSLEEIRDYLWSHLEPHELILTLGAGNITELSRMLVGKSLAPNPKTEQENKIVYAPLKLSAQRQVV